MTMTMTLEAAAEEAIRNALRGVIETELGDDVVDLGMVQRIDIDTEHNVAITVAATCRIVAIASGKGGVGKPSVTVNLAALLAQRGLTVGVLDADIGGFSIPRMLGVAGNVVARTTETGKARFPPLERNIGPGVVKVVSMGSITGAEEDEAIMWRGLMLNRAVQHFIEDVDWGALDYLLIDMPPGTADIQMGLARMLPRTDVIIVTTPALAAQQVAARAADMARKGHLRVAGVIENMSATIGPDGSRHAVFGEGGGERLAQQLGVALLGSIPSIPPSQPAVTLATLLRWPNRTLKPWEHSRCRPIGSSPTPSHRSNSRSIASVNSSPSPAPTSNPPSIASTKPQATTRRQPSPRPTNKNNQGATCHEYHRNHPANTHP